MFSNEQIEVKKEKEKVPVKMLETGKGTAMVKTEDSEMEMREGKREERALAKLEKKRKKEEEEETLVGDPLAQYNGSTDLDLALGETRTIPQWRVWFAGWIEGVTDFRRGDVQQSRFNAVVGTLSKGINRPNESVVAFRRRLLNDFEKALKSGNALTEEAQDKVKTAHAPPSGASGPERKRKARSENVDLGLGGSHRAPPPAMPREQRQNTGATSTGFWPLRGSTRGGYGSTRGGYDSALPRGGYHKNKSWIRSGYQQSAPSPAPAGAPTGPRFPQPFGSNAFEAFDMEESQRRRERERKSKEEHLAALIEQQKHVLEELAAAKKEAFKLSVIAGNGQAYASNQEFWQRWQLSNQRSARWDNENKALVLDIYQAKTDLGLDP